MDEVMAEINDLVTNNDYPLEVIVDVNRRLECCRDVYYVKQQLRYLQNYKRLVLDKEKERK